MWADANLIGSLLKVLSTEAVHKKTENDDKLAISTNVTTRSLRYTTLLKLTKVNIN